MTTIDDKLDEAVKVYVLDGVWVAGQKRRSGQSSRQLRNRARHGPRRRAVMPEMRMLYVSRCTSSVRHLKRTKAALPVRPDRRKDLHPPALRPELGRPCRVRRRRPDLGRLAVLGVDDVYDIELKLLA
jgi:hypothetical protein